MIGFVLITDFDRLVLLQAIQVLGQRRPSAREIAKVITDLTLFEQYLAASLSGSVE
jgi:hypothetical protein